MQGLLRALRGGSKETWSYFSTPYFPDASNQFPFLMSLMGIGEVGRETHGDRDPWGQETAAAACCNPGMQAGEKVVFVVSSRQAGSQLLSQAPDSRTDSGGLSAKQQLPPPSLPPPSIAAHRPEHSLCNSTLAPGLPGSPCADRERERESITCMCGGEALGRAAFPLPGEGYSRCEHDTGGEG